MVTMEKNVYMGGAVSNSDYSLLCPTITKFDENLNVEWSFTTVGCTSTTSMAVDIMYADHMNNNVYGLMVPRSVDGNLISSNKFTFYFITPLLMLTVLKQGTLTIAHCVKLKQFNSSHTEHQPVVNIGSPWVSITINNLILPVKLLLLPTLN
jgi:hypothetical protein